MATTSQSNDLTVRNLAVTGVLDATSIVGPITGAVTGAVTGNVTGNLTGNVTGEINGAHLDSNATGVAFYGATPAAKQTGVAVTAEAIHAALVALGLIGA